MQPDRCLQVCLIGDSDIGISAFLRAYRDDEGEPQPEADIESVIACVELDGEPCYVRFTDNAGSIYFESLRDTAFGTAHVVLFCFSMDSPQSLEHVKERWIPHFWETCSEAPIFIVGLRTDMCVEAGAEIVEGAEAEAFARQQGALAFLECSALYPSTVRSVVDQALVAAKEYYSLQWQLCPVLQTPGPEPVRHPVHDAREDLEEGLPWPAHERLNINEDPRCLDEQTASKNLSVLGLTPTRQHAFLRLDIPDMGLTSLEGVRRYKHLQFVNVSKNHLRSLEPLGALRCLLHLNASYNHLIRTQSFTAPDALETVDMSYNMIGSLGQWGVHKYLRELNLRGNFISHIGSGLRRNVELRMLDLSENHIPRIENLDGLGVRTLFLAQNRLTSLDGIGSLNKLQVLNVRHNNITSMAALRAEDIPRLRKVFISENRITRTKDIEGLQRFSFLCDLVLMPNPVTQLPHYRAQVAHRLPRLRLLDTQAVTAEEKVKADVIYGADVEAQREVFEQMLPEETFVDRRLVTEEVIGQLEVEQFGKQGDAGPYGLLAAPEAVGDTAQAAGAQKRTRLQKAKFLQRLEQACCGGRPNSVADFATFAAPFASITVRDLDIQQILEAVEQGGVMTLVLGAADLSVDSVQEIIAYLHEAPTLRHVDLTGCAAVKSIGTAIVNGFPYARGSSLEAAGCGLLERDVQRLRNKTKEAEEALRRTKEERRRTEELVAQYLSWQEALEDEAAENRTQALPPPPPVHLCHPKKWRDGIEATAQAANKSFWTMNPNGLKSADGSTAGTVWCMVCKDKSPRRFGQDEITALCQLRDSMLQEWGYLISVEEEGEVCWEEEVDVSHRRFSEGNPDRPLPKAFQEAFDPVRQNDNLLGFMVWEGVEPSTELVQEIRQKREEWEAAWKRKQMAFSTLSNAARKLYDVHGAPGGVASGQIIAHFSYLCLGRTLTGLNDPVKPCEYFGLKRVSQAPRPPPRHGQDLHKLLASKEVVIEDVSGCSFGKGSLRIRLRSLASYSIGVSIRRGTIFQHVDWEHRQNLMICIEYILTVPAGGELQRNLDAYCMNLSCACSSGNPMSLTDFYFDNAEVLESQGRIWDHFESKFNAR